MFQAKDSLVDMVAIDQGRGVERGAACLGVSCCKWETVGPKYSLLQGIPISMFIVMRGNQHTDTDTPTCENLSNT